MKKLFLIITMCLIMSTSQAQESKPFQCEIENKEYKVFFKLDLYDQTISIKGQEDIYGDMDGYLGSKQSTQFWIITDSEMVNDHCATITMINIYGSEDITAQLTYKDDGTYLYEYKQGSSLKFAVNNKWQKLPKSMVFKVVEKQK